MLKALIRDAAQAYDATGHASARQIAALLRALNFRRDGTNTIELPSVKSSAVNSLPPSLSQALAASDCHAAAGNLAALAEALPWSKSGVFRPLTESFIGSYHFAVLVGSDGVIPSEQLRFGVYLQEPRTFYPSHKHAAEEFYFVLSGLARWQKDAGEFQPVASGNLIHHLADQPHATWTNADPVLAFWAWLGDLALDTYSFVPAEGAV